MLATSASANAFEDEIVSRGEQVVSCNRQILQNSSQWQLPLDLWKMILSDHDPIREVKFFNTSHTSPWDTDCEQPEEKFPVKL